MEDLTLFQVVTLIIASIGAVLGIINTWHGLSRSRVKLRVSAGHAVPVGGAPVDWDFYIEVINLSEFPVTVTDVGVFYHGTSNRGSFTNPILPDGGPWPRRLDPRAAVSVVGQRPESSPEMRIKCAYARTACGATVTAMTPALQQIANGR